MGFAIKNKFVSFECLIYDTRIKFQRYEVFTVGEF